jgi:hypothetical protein
MDGSLDDPQLGNATLRGGEDVDVFYVASHHDPTEDMPVYIVNNFVDIDGGTGWNNLTLFGTEQDDKYIVENGIVSSGSLSVDYMNIAYLAVAGEAGNDEITILNTNPDTHLSVFGGMGSDTFIFTPTTISPVESKNRRGHRGVIEHRVVASDDEGYDGLVVKGVEANVMDNDGVFAWIYIVDQEGPHLMTEDGNGAFSFQLYPTTAPQADLYFNVIAPAERDTDGRPYVLVNGDETAVFSWASGVTTPTQIQLAFQK